MTAQTLISGGGLKAVVSVFGTRGDGERAVAARIAAVIRERAAEGRRAVLGLATGRSVTGIYAELVRLHREEGLSFANVVSFNLDEYHGLAPEDARSYHWFMREHLFGKVDARPENVHVPEGTLAPAATAAHCADYERLIGEAGGLDLQLLGVGRTGHIGFNEPGSGKETRTRLVTLDAVTRRDAAGDFGGEDKVPRQAVSMGVGTILEAREIVLVAWGRAKAAVVRRAVFGAVTDALPASFLQEHGRVNWVLDAQCGGEEA
ncbi:MAG: 6-phosphogluconolactonase [Opitutaceae bacterium]|jgi:glucosamine-6-phosphate deaminase|nr:6-phosphogluconolactonase [Opitutaceae bacterium]